MLRLENILLYRVLPGRRVNVCDRAVRSWAALQFVVFLHADLVAAG